MKNTDYAYLAGLIDGEGCISIYQNNKYSKSVPENNMNLSLRVGNTNVAVMDWLLDNFSGTVNPLKKEGNRKQAYSWSIQGEKAAEILSKVSSFLIIKKQQADIAKAFQKLKLPYKGTKNAVIQAELVDKIRSLNKKGNPARITL